MLRRRECNAFGPARLAGPVLVLLLACASASAADSPLPVPKALSVRRADLPTGFRESVPGSIAELRAMQQHVEALVRRVSPAVVAVEIDGSSGSGVVIGTNGLVVTAGHVCGEPNRPVLITFPDGKTVRARTLGLDADSDTGLIRITDKGTWPAVPMGDLTEARVGDWVLALGNPGGFDVRRSLVVRLGRIIRLLPDVVQSDCTIAPGDSGGPLIDMHGRVIGVHRAINPSLAGNFHVPVSEFYDTWEELVKVAAGPDDRAVVVYPGASAVDAAEGCRLSAVDQDSPASRAGLKVGDLVLTVDGHEIKAAAMFRRWVNEADPGEVLNLGLKRGEELMKLTLKVGAPPAGKAKP